MKKIRTMPVACALLTVALLSMGCGKTEQAPVDDVITPLNNEQVIQLWEMSTAHETIGEPVTMMFEDTVNGGTISRKVTTQHFKFTFNVDEKGHPLPPVKDGTTTSARMIQTGYGITTCSSSCASLIVGQSCGASGCDPKGASCTDPTCKSGCYSYNCTKLSSGFTRGMVIM